MHMRVSDVIDQAPLSRFLVRTIVLCALVSMLDGFDITAMAVVMPRVSREWGIAASVLGPVLSATFAGILVGTTVFGVLGDRIGRRVVLISAFSLAGAMSLLSSLAESVTQLLILRFATGLGIGGALPNVVALTAECVPSSKRVSLVTLMYAGVPVGGSIVGFLAPYLIDAYGWQSVFVVGGVFPLAICVLLYIWLPESPRFLVLQGKHPERVGRLLHKINPAYAYLPDHEFIVDKALTRSSVKSLFTEGRGPLTLLVWVIAFSSYFGFYMLSSWLPTIFTNAKWPPAIALQTVSIFTLGSIFGGLILSWLMDRSRTFVVLGLGYFTAGALAMTVGSVTGPIPQMMALVVLAGMAYGGSQLCLVAVISNIYPTISRATGVGWALTAGRLGAVISPMVAGLAITAEWRISSLFALAAVPAVIAAFSSILTSMCLHGRETTTTPDRSLAAAFTGTDHK